MKLEEFNSEREAREYLGYRGWVQQPGTQVYTNDDLAGERRVIIRADERISHSTFEHSISSKWELHSI